MSNTKYTPSKNNPNFFEDKTERQQALRHTLEIARDKSYYGESVVIKPIKWPIFSNIAIIIGADVHSGAVGSNAVREEKAIKFVRNTANSIYVPAGDTFNSVIKSEEDKHEDKFGNLRAIDREVYLLSKIVKKIPLIIDGNHDGANGKRWMASNMSPVKHLADTLGVQHVEFGALLQIRMPTSGYNRVQKEMNVFVSHCAGKSGGSAKSVDVTFNKAMAELENMGIIPDVIFGGHFHSNSNGVLPKAVKVYNKQGKLTGFKRKDIIVVSESTLQETSRYALAAGFPPSDSNVYVNNFRLVKNQFYNASTKDTQEEYIVELTRFPMFRENSDEYTDEAKQYMAMYKEPDLRAEVAKEYQGKSYTESVESLTQEVKDFRSAKAVQEEGFTINPQAVPEDDTEAVEDPTTDDVPPVGMDDDFDM